MSEISATRKAAVWVGVVFLLGTALGGTLGYSYAHHLVSAASIPFPEPARRAKRVAQLTEMLNLTSTQSQQVDAILLQKHTEAKAVHDQADAQLAQVHQKGRDEIRAILTPEQKPKFEEFLKKLDAERKRNASPPGH
jgi:Spy/CpxP family protein refolding chaperone